MKLLAIDTSSGSASCAISEDGVLLGEFFTNIKLTHSQTILPMLENLLEQTRISLAEIDLFAVTIGPGSFTGLRIGLSAVKGMAHALGRPCIGVSTLEALACHYSGTDCLVAPVLDARCAQVYTALFQWQGETVIRLEADEAITIEALGKRLENQKNKVYLVGDGAELCYNSLKDRLPSLAPAASGLRYTRAFAVARAAQWRMDQAVDAAALAPAYLRLPQAERELLAREAEKRETKE